MPMSPDLNPSAAGAQAQFAPGTQAGNPARDPEVLAQWTAVRQRCGLLDGSLRALLRLGGADRTTFLQGMVTNDVANLKEGQGAPAALLTIQGKIVSDLRIYVLAEEIWLDVPAGRAEAVREALERFIIADDVEFVAAGPCAPLAAIEGPESERVFTAATGAQPPSQAFEHACVELDGVTLRAAAVSHAGERGFLFFGPPDAGAALRRRCAAAGAEAVGSAALDILRVEAGIPWHGRDMDESTLISEVGLEEMISFRKGCYLGQEVVERVAARGQVHRKLVGLVCDGNEVPAADTALTLDGKDAGRLTSAVWSPGRGAVIGLGYLRRELCAPGSAVEIALATPRHAVVEPLPFKLK